VCRFSGENLKCTNLPNVDSDRASLSTRSDKCAPRLRT